MLRPSFTGDQRAAQCSATKEKVCKNFGNAITFIREMQVKKDSANPLEMELQFKRNSVLQKREVAKTLEMHEMEWTLSLELHSTVEIKAKC